MAQCWQYFRISLSIDFFSSGCGELQKIQKNCRKLKTINVYGWNLNIATLSKCLASYEGQLEYATIHGMKVEELEFVFISCTHARFNLNISEYVETNWINVQFAMYPSLPIGWDSCPNLQAVDLTGISELLYVQDLLNSPKPLLRKLRLNFRSWYFDGSSHPVDLKKVMDAITVGGITALESFSLDCSLPQANAFNKLFAMNKSLSDFEIYIPDEEPFDRFLFFDRLTEIAECYFQSPALASPIISAEQELLREQVDWRNYSNRIPSPPRLCFYMRGGNVLTCLFINYLLARIKHID